MSIVVEDKDAGNRSIIIQVPRVCSTIALRVSHGSCICMCGQGGYKYPL